jgi:hypothetical protein
MSYVLQVALQLVIAILFVPLKTLGPKDTIHIVRDLKYLGANREHDSLSVSALMDAPFMEDLGHLNPS